MTKAEAYRECAELRRRRWSWPLGIPPTPYTHAVLRRIQALYDYWHSDEPAPCESDIWKCPPQDVEETPENYWRAAFIYAHDPEAAFQRAWKKYNGEYPPLDTEWTEELRNNFGD